MMAHRTTLEEERLARTPKAAMKTEASSPAKTASTKTASDFRRFRRWGYLEATSIPSLLSR